MFIPRISQFLVILLSLSISAGTNAIAGNKYGYQKVVYHINYDDPKKQAGTLRNIQNHINAVGAENMDVKVIIHGHGLSLLLEPDSLDRLKKFRHANANDSMTARIDSLRDQGVAFDVCANTVKSRNIDIDTDLYNVERSDIVPSGAAELSYLQQRGYTYIKP